MGATVQLLTVRGVAGSADIRGFGQWGGVLRTPGAICCSPGVQGAPLHTFEIPFGAGAQSIQYYNGSPSCVTLSNSYCKLSIPDMPSSEDDHDTGQGGEALQFPPASPPQTGQLPELWSHENVGRKKKKCMLDSL